MRILRFERAGHGGKGTLQVCLSILLVLVFSSCSFTALHRVPGDYKVGDDLECTSDLTYPLIDMAGTVLSGVIAISLISSGTNEERNASLTSAGIATGALALGLATSAIYGTHQVNRCRNARNAAGQSDGPPLPDGDRPLPGAEGGSCLDNGQCNDDLVCDAPMQTCIAESEDW